MIYIYLYVASKRKCLSKTENYRYFSKLGKKIVKNIAAQKYKCSENEIIMVYSDNGKPYLKEHPDFHFNISHSENAVVIAICEEEIGIDIEKLKKPNFKVADRFFTDSEKDYIKRSDYPDLAFYDIWTAKEAYVKHSGKGVDADFKNISVKNDSINNRMNTLSIEDYVISFYTKNINSYKIIRLENSEIFKSLNLD